MFDQIRMVGSISASVNHLNKRDEDEENPLYHPQMSSHSSTLPRTGGAFPTNHMLTNGTLMRKPPRMNKLNNSNNENAAALPRFAGKTGGGVQLGTRSSVVSSGVSRGEGDGAVVSVITDPNHDTADGCYGEDDDEEKRRNIVEFLPDYSDDSADEALYKPDKGITSTLSKFSTVYRVDSAIESAASKYGPSKLTQDLNRSKSEGVLFHRPGSSADGDIIEGKLGHCKQ